MRRRSDPARQVTVEDGRMPEYPSGTVAFLFTDIEGSTARWERDSPAMRQAVERHFTLLREAIEPEHGVLFKTIGDAAQAAFPSVPAAVAAAIAAAHALAAADWGPPGPLRVRMAVHVGVASPVDGDYLAPVLNRLARIVSAGHGDQILLSEAARALASAALPAGVGLRDLGEHRLKDLLDAEHIYQVTGPGLPGEFPPLRSLDGRPHNLPAQPTELIGREIELEQVRQLLTAPAVRLLTLTGPGGTGKTRLAVQAAADLLEAFPDGVWWVPLAGLTDPALVPTAIAAPLGVREQAGEALVDTLAEHLRTRRLLLVLDNLEQVVSAAPLLARLLEAAPDLVMLVTSREPLRVRSEHELPIAPLPLPRPTPRLTAEDALSSPAVQLFLARAQAVKPNFVITDENAAAVAAICQRLDGLPLAIELAAARVRLLAPAALLARLEKRLPLLTGGARDLPERQQTLRAAIAWSHDLLVPAEQSLFARLAVFAGGCTIEAALAVAAAGAGLDIDLIDGLEGLVQKSLLRQSDDLAAEPRFTMLQTIREFGLEQLAAQPSDETAVRSAHAAYFRQLVDDAIHTDQEVSAYGELEAEVNNLRGVLDWHERHEDPASVLSFATDLRWFWWVRGHLREGQTRLEAALRNSATAPPEMRATALEGLGVLLEASGDYDRAKACYEDALAIFRQVGDQQGIAAGLDNLGTIALVEGDLRASETLREEALALRRAMDDRRAIAVSLNNLGQVAYIEHNVERAIELFEEARVLSRETGDRWILATSLGNLGGALNRKARSGVVGTSSGETPAALEASATALVRQALEIWQELGDREGILDCLLTLADLALPTDPHRAAMLLGAAEAVAAATGHQVAPADPDQHRDLIASARSSLGAEAFAESWHAGERLTVDEAIALAIAVA
jgi:predicted ATPase/class 3 adenylate cyclase